MFSRIFKWNKIYGIIGIVLSLSLLPIKVYAAPAAQASSMSDSNPVCTITDAQNDEGKIKTWIATCNNTLYNSNLNIYFLEANSETQSNGVVNVNIRVNMQDYKEFTTKEQQEIYTIVFATLADSVLSKTSRNKIYNFISAQDKSVSSLVRQLSDDTQADFYTAYQWWKPFSGPVSTFLAFIAILIVVLLGITMVLDLAFLTIPAFTMFCLTTTKSEKPRIVSFEAFTAMQQSEAFVGNGYKSSVGIYFRLKFKQLIAVSICLLYLISGQLWDLVVWFVDLFRGMLISP